MAGDRRSHGRRNRLFVFSSLALALAPKCPLCVLAYAGLLGSSVTLAWSAAASYGRWIGPVTAVCLALSVGGIAVQARRSRSLGAAGLAAAAAASIYAGKFLFDQTPFVYLGMAALAAAAVWGSRATPEEVCPCTPSLLSPPFHEDEVSQ